MLWSRAVGVQICPRELGEKPKSARFREVPKHDLQGRSVMDLDRKSFEVGEITFRFRALGKRLLIVRKP